MLLVRSHSALAVLRGAVLAILGAVALTVVPVNGAQAAGIVYECKSSTTSCITFSGYAGRSVWGYPVNATGNNCVNYAAFRLSLNGARRESALGNAGSWAASARARGYRVDTVPATGAIAQWAYGSHYAPSLGHVGYVEEVTPSYIVISDSAWSGGSSRWRIPRGDPNWPNAFIHFRDVPYQPPANGSFVSVREDGSTYRLVGGAPVFVSTWTAFGGRQPTTPISSTSLATLPLRPADGTYVKGAQRGEVYVIAGGAPIPVVTWAGVGGTRPAMLVDQVAIDRAGGGGAYTHLASRPADGTVLHAVARDELYRVAGGAPVFVSSWANIGGVRPSVDVDQAAIDKAGSGGRFNHLLFRPVNYSFVRGATTGRVYQMTGGVAYYVKSWDIVGGPKPTTTIDQAAVDHAGTTDVIKWTHIVDTRPL
jgi:surface antigen